MTRKIRRCFLMLILCGFLSSVEIAYSADEELDTPEIRGYVIAIQDNSSVKLNLGSEKGIEKKIVTRDRVVLIRSGIDREQFQQEAGTAGTKKKELTGSDAIPLVAMIACLKPQKAPLDFVRVADMVLRSVSKAHFILVGDGVLRAQVETLIKQLGRDPSIVLLGWRRDVTEIMKCIDVLVLTSRWEGLPRVLPQAMSLGVPIVATGVDGSPEAVRNGVNGFVLPPGDIEGMAEKIIYLITHPEKARAMGEKGKQFVSEFDIWKMMAQQEKLYLDLLNGTDHGSS